MIDSLTRIVLSGVCILPWVALHSQTLPPLGRPEKRAFATEAQLTDEERISLVRSRFARPDHRALAPLPADAILSASYTQGVARLGIPALKETDASMGVSWIFGLRKDGATALPSSLSLAATWDPETARRGSALIAKEARAKGFNVLLAGGVNLAREPRNGRNFEYLGEDPLLAGVMAGEAVAAIEAAGMISTIKHFALNAQETGRSILNARIADTAARESDLLAFKIAIDRGKPGAVMCSYGRYNGISACGNDLLLNHILKREWKYPGFVMSDWGAVRSVNDLINGLDRQSAEELDERRFFSGELPGKIVSDPAFRVRLRDATRRILRSMYSAGLFDNPPVVKAIDPAEGLKLSRTAASQGMVLLKNGGILPLLKTANSVAVIGGFAGSGVMSGGGSSQVQPAEGPGLSLPASGENRRLMLHPSPPLEAIRQKLGPQSRLRFDQGWSPAAAANLARNAEVAIVFATQWLTEGADAGDLALPSGQDATIAAVAAANPNTIVVLETGGPVLMPWLKDVAAVVEAWYPGAAGGNAIADVLFGDVDPGGRLPITFPASLEQLPRLRLDDTTDPLRDIGSQRRALKGFDVDYDVEGADVGYRWYARRDLKPLFPFGYGLSYTRFSYSGLKLTGGKTLRASFYVKNDGQREGRDVPQVYVSDRSGRAGIRLIGWSNVTLAPGETKRVEVEADPRLLADWSAEKQGWVVPSGRYQVQVSPASDRITLTASANVVRSIIR